MNEFPKVLDSTMVTAFRACPEQFRREYIEHLRPAAPNVHLHAGAAFASGIEAARKAFYLDNASTEDAEQAGIVALTAAYGDFQAPEGSVKTCARMVDALRFYLQNYPLSRENGYPLVLGDGKLAVECNAAVPLDTLHPVSGEPLLYCGRIDAALVWDGMVLLTDEKTASQLGAQWASKWTLRNQFLGYMWLMRAFGVKASGMLVRGIAVLAESRSTNAARAAAKKLYDTQNTIILYSEWMIERWKAQLELTAKRMVRAWETGEWEMDFGDACTAYAGCAFKPLCEVQYPENYIEGNYRQVVWEPLTRTERESSNVN